MTDSEKKASDADAGVKETIESILVAFILAFIFRAFVVEAFVIPTGSMAPTLLGAHMRFTCPDCGYTFDVNYTSPTATAHDTHIDPDGYPAADIYCPNCGKFIAPAGRNSGSPPIPVDYGDRILVLKYVYLLHDPHRWDVVVFKSPDDPANAHYTENFIKRLVGKPGEELMVLNGNIYVSNDHGASWQVQTKPREVQEALWRIIYDNDFYPHLKQRTAPDFQQPWEVTSGSGWNLGTDYTHGRTFKFDNSVSSGRLRFDPQANSTTHTTTDYLVYDAGSEIRRPGPTGLGSPDDNLSNPVSDLKLAAYYHRVSGNGVFQLRLIRHDESDHIFSAQITPDSVSLVHDDSRAGHMQIGSKHSLSEFGVKPGASIFVELLTADYQVTLRINGKVVEQTTPKDFAPNVEWLREQYEHHVARAGEAEIEADGQVCTLDHIGLWKSVYYTNLSSNYRVGTPNNPVILGPTEYFTMGDNSAVSDDARVWPYPIDLPEEDLKVDAGRVPAQFLLGQAIFVYWPAGYRAVDHLSVIPNFGDMRWIH